MINEHYLYSELTGRIIGCAIEVHKTLGNGFMEVIYQRALEIEMMWDGPTRLTGTLPKCHMKMELNLQSRLSAQLPGQYCLSAFGEGRGRAVRF